MKSLKVKLFTVVSLFVLMIAMLIIGVWAIGQSQTISLQGSVSFNIADKSLYVKDIRVKSVTTNESSTMPEFVPGYINGDFVLNLGSVASTSGSIGIFFDIINLTDKSFVASTSSAIENAKVSVSGSINGDNVSESDLITTDVISGTIELIIEAPTLNEISLNNIVIDIVEMPDLVINYNNSLGSATYTKEGLNYVLTATLNNNSVFYGWWDSYSDEYKGFTIGDTLTFVLPYTEGMSTTYYADFGTIDDAVFTFTYDSPAEGEAAARSSYLNEEEYMEVPSAVNYNGTTYVVTQLQGFDSYRSVVKELIIPSTIINWKSSFGYVSDFYGMAGLTTVHLRSGFDGTLMLDDQNHTIFNIFTENDASRATTFIIDSKEVYDAFANLAYGMPQTVKFPQSIDDGSNAYLASSYTLSTTEVINGRTYNVYTQN